MQAIKKRADPFAVNTKKGTFLRAKEIPMKSNECENQGNCIKTAKRCNLYGMSFNWDVNK